MARKIVRAKNKRHPVKERTPQKVDVFKIIDNVENEHPVTRKNHLDMIYRYAMYLGYQYFKPNYEDNELVEDLQMRDARCTYNYLAAFADTFDAKMLKDRPIPQFYPMGFEPEDIQAARFDNIAVESWWKKQDVSTLLYEAHGWATQVGTGFIKEYYNDEDGDVISADQIKFHEGEGNIEVFPPWNGFPDPRATSMKNARWFIHLYPMPISTLDRIYKKFAGKISPEVIEDYRSMLASYTDGDTEEDEDTTGPLKEECVMVREYWERGVEGHDAGHGEGNGRYIVRANGVTLHDGPNPYKKRLPFHALTVKKPADSFWGVGLLDGIIGMQIDLNRVLSLTMENIDWTSIVKFVAPKGLKLEENAVNKLSGELIQVDPMNGETLHQLAIQSQPAYVLQFKGEILQAMMDNTGLHQISFAQLPPRSAQMSGRALNTLVESEQARFAREISRTSTVLKDIALFYLEMVQEKFTTKKKMAIIGRYRGTEVASFDGSDLRGQTDAYVDVGSGFGLTASARNDHLMMLFDRKAIDAATLLRLSEFGGDDKLYYEATLDENKANRHLRAILTTGIAPNVSAYDNHQEIIRVFRNFVRNPEYDKLDPKIQGVIEAYMDEHSRKEMEFAMRMKKIQDQVAAENAPPQPAQPALTTGGPGQPSQAMTPDQTMQGMESAMGSSPGAPPSQDMGGMMPPQGA